MTLTNPIFIVGCSRSGTCLLGEILKKHSNVHCLVEYPTTFKYAQRLAIHRKEHHNPQTIDNLQNLYDNAWRKTWRKCQNCSSACRKVQYQKHGILSPCYVPSQITRYADKSHQHVVNVNLLRRAFPQSQFLHIYRDARDVVTSMLRYDRLVRRFSTKVKINENSCWPQPWYGIENKEQYCEWQEWSLAKKMAWAWESRIREAKKCASQLSPSQWMDICYETLLNNPAQVTKEIFQFLDLPYEAQTHSHLYEKNSQKWKTLLQPQQLSDIIDNAPSLRDLGYSF
ncbi:sulfotransferase [Candidatus Uabimicrobium amorphum]|uniref:Sulfotransferase n=2 Tax=Uabimicrobium amorphum TaxID=2596890 RepID=A0A5S9ISC9_UABAM|nr:sulfotransferase [Candidatus Uabimicrobium amorphum]BBM87024.1 sulfotransferase [Candidatus Uabimicrobium amorphum]